MENDRDPTTTPGVLSQKYSSLREKSNSVPLLLATLIAILKLLQRVKSTEGKGLSGSEWEYLVWIEASSNHEHQVDSKRKSPVGNPRPQFKIFTITF